MADTNAGTTGAATSSSSNSSKRNSVAGKVATPRTRSVSSATGNAGAAGTHQQQQQRMDAMEGLRKAVGARLKLTTIGPDSQSLEGTLITADPLTNLIAINTRAPSASNSAIDAHIIPVSKIQSFQLLSVAQNGPAGFANATPVLGPVDLQRLRKREDERVAKLQEQLRDRGAGVTREAQDIFDALKRINVPVRWHGKEIIAHEAVIIVAPYRPDDCKGPNAAHDVVARVKKVLEGERKKLKLKEDKAKAEAEERKGG